MIIFVCIHIFLFILWIWPKYWEYFNQIDFKLYDLEQNLYSLASNKRIHLLSYGCNETSWPNMVIACFTYEPCLALSDRLLLWNRWSYETSPGDAWAISDRVRSKLRQLCETTPWSRSGEEVAKWGRRNIAWYYLLEICYIYMIWMC